MLGKKQLIQFPHQRLTLLLLFACVLLKSEFRSLPSLRVTPSCQTMKRSWISITHRTHALAGFAPKRSAPRHCQVSLSWQVRFVVWEGKMVKVQQEKERERERDTHTQYKHHTNIQQTHIHITRYVITKFHRPAMTSHELLLRSGPEQACRCACRHAAWGHDT